MKNLSSKRIALLSVALITFMLALGTLILAGISGGMSLSGLSFTTSLIVSGFGCLTSIARGEQKKELKDKNKTENNKGK